ALVRALGAGQDGPRRLRQIGSTPRRDDTGQGPRIAHVDRADARVAMGASHHAEVQQSLAGHVVEIPAGAHEEAAVFLASRRAADQVAGLVHAAQCNRRGPASGQFASRASAVAALDEEARSRWPGYPDPLGSPTAAARLA